MQPPLHTKATEKNRKSSLESLYLFSKMPRDEQKARVGLDSSETP